MNRRQRTIAFLSAALRQRGYARPGAATCVTCGDVGPDDRVVAFACALDLGLAMGDGVDVDGVDVPGALDTAIAARGLPFCARCAARIVPFAIAIAGNAAPRDCPCRALEGLTLGPLVPACAFAFGLVLGDEVKRCDVCKALGNGIPAHGD